MSRSVVVQIVRLFGRSPTSKERRKADVPLYFLHYLDFGVERAV